MTDKTPTPRTEDTPTQFDYLLNAMEAAGLADKPAECGYGDKRKALFAHVRALERNLIACRAALVELVRLLDAEDSPFERPQTIAVAEAWIAARAILAKGEGK